MKKITKIILIILVAALTMSLFSCDVVETVKNGLFGVMEDVEEAIDSIGAYTFSDIVITQVDPNTFDITFTVRCGDDPVEIYLTEGYRLTASSTPKDVTSVKNGDKTTFTFTETLELGESYYIWAVYGEKAYKTAITPPSMFPILIDQDNGDMLFHFKYTYGTAWADFCDPEGKAIYASEKPVFDETAKCLVDGISISQEDYLITADQFNPDLYYFAVSTVKEGLITTISSPVIASAGIISEVKDITAKITSDLYFRVDVTLKDNSALSDSVEDNLQLLVKTDIADDVIVGDCSFNNGVATMLIDFNELDWDGIWYDVCLVWNGSVISELPQYFGGKQVNTSSTIKVDGVVYGITGWKAEGAPEHTEMMKVYFEKDTTKYADELFKSYLVSFSGGTTGTLKVTAVLKDGVKNAPVLALTGGNTNKLCEVAPTLNDDGSYTYLLPVKSGMTSPDTWYDIRFFVGNTAYEVLKDSCIAYADFAASYTADGRTYSFREWNGFLKIMFL